MERHNTTLKLISLVAESPTIVSILKVVSTSASKANPRFYTVSDNFDGLRSLGNRLQATIQVLFTILQRCIDPPSSPQDEEDFPYPVLEMWVKLANDPLLQPMHTIILYQTAPLLKQQPKLFSCCNPSLSELDWQFPKVFDFLHMIRTLIATSGDQVEHFFNQSYPRTDQRFIKSFSKHLPKLRENVPRDLLDLADLANTVFRLKPKPNQTINDQSTTPSEQITTQITSPTSTPTPIPTTSQETTSQQTTSATWTPTPTPATTPIKSTTPTPTPEQTTQSTTTTTQPHNPTQQPEQQQLFPKEKFRPISIQQQKVEARRARDPNAGKRKYNPDPNGMD